MCPSAFLSLSAGTGGCCVLPAEMRARDINNMLAELASNAMPSPPFQSLRLATVKKIMVFDVQSANSFVVAGADEMGADLSIVPSFTVDHFL